MDPRWQRLDALFHAAVLRPAAERRGFVRREAADDPALAVEVDALLDAHEQSSALLDAPLTSRLPPGMRLGPYAVDRVLGVGGMATVYLAHRADRQFDKHVAIKLVNLGLAASLGGDRVEQERQILARLDHPNIARLLDAGVSSFGQPYLVMDLVEGTPLDTWAHRTTPARERRLALWLDVAAAVAHAHRHLVVHRDLKPSNVLVTPDGTPKLLDFGIAALLDTPDGRASLTRSRRFTPQYASPEQVRGEPATIATDVYGLGLLLFELVVGAPAYADNDDALALARSIVEDDVVVPTSVPAELSAVLQKALRKDPARRYSSVDHFADDIRRYSSGWPVDAVPETWAYRTRKFVGRHRGAVVLGVAAAVTLVAITAIAVRQARVAEQQRARAEAVTRFVTSFLGATPTEPDWALQNKGVSLRVSELADLVSARLGTELGTQPEAEATLRSVLAMSYYQMGEIAKAQEHAQRAIALDDALYPPDDPQRSSIEILQGAIDLALGQFAAAERRLVSVRRQWPSASPATLSVIAANLGTAQFRLGRLDEAERTFAEAMTSVEAALGPMHPALGLLSSNFALVSIERGRFADAARLLERSAAISRATIKDVSMPLAWALVNLANTYRFLGRVDESLHAAEESLRHFEGALGPTHFSTIHPLAAIAWAKAARGDADAETFIRRGIANQAPLAADHYERAVGQSYLGFVLLQKGDLNGARAALESALAVRRKAFAAPNWRIAETAGWLGETLARQGHVANARALLEESASTFATLYGADNPRTQDARARLTRVTASAPPVPRATAPAGLTAR